jgi:hypothetical protein
MEHERLTALVSQGKAPTVVYGEMDGGQVGAASSWESPEEAKNLLGRERGLFKKVIKVRFVQKGDHEARFRKIPDWVFDMLGNPAEWVQ